MSIFGEGKENKKGEKCLEKISERKEGRKQCMNFSPAREGELEKNDTREPREWKLQGGADLIFFRYFFYFFFIFALLSFPFLVTVILRQESQRREDMPIGIPRMRESNGWFFGREETLT